MAKQKNRIPFAVVAETKVYPFIVEYYSARGYMPTLAEIGYEMGKSREWARDAVKELESKGRVRVISGKRRNIELV